MGALRSSLNFFQDYFMNLDWRLSLHRDTLYFVETLAPPKVRKIAKNLLRSTYRGPGSTHSRGRHARIRI